MAATGLTHKQKPLSVGISYGFLGGPATGYKLRGLLRKLGFTEAQDLRTADIILAHSAGTWLIPQEARPKLVIFVGMPLPRSKASHRTFLHANRQTFKGFIHNLHVLTGLHIALCSIYYGLTQPRRNWRIIREVSMATPNIAPTARHVFIVNQYDPWPQAKKLHDYLDEHPWAFISLPGSHDDIWEHSTHYTAIIEYYARLLD